MASDVALDRNSYAQPQPRPADDRLATLAGRQHGVVARSQLAALGFSPHAVDYRVRIGRLHPLHRGVYAVGHRIVSIHGHRMAAVLSAGAGAVLSHRDAAAEWAILQNTSGPVHVTVVGARHRRQGLVLHRCRLRADEVTANDGIPLTTVSRTIFDMAATESRARVETGIHEAEVRRLGDAVGLPRLIERYPGARGTATLRAILSEHGTESSITKEGIVELFFGFLDEYNLPRPLTDYWVTANGSSYECDAVYSGRRVIIELDGYATHSTRRKFELDRVRDRDLQMAGWIVIRVTWRQLRHEREALARDLRRLLTRAVAA